MASERKFVAENIRRVLLKEYLMKTVDRAGFGGVDVQRTPMGTGSRSSPRGRASSSGAAAQPSRRSPPAIERQFQVRQPPDRGPRGRRPQPERPDHGREARLRAGAGLALPPGRALAPYAASWTRAPGDASSSSPAS